MKKLAITLALATLGLGTLAGCPKESALTFGEAAQALEEAQASTQAASVVGATIELTTSFTIGAAVEQAAQEIGAFIAAQLPCAEIALAGGELTVHYGALPGNCAYQGQTLTGTHTIGVVKNAAGEIVVSHEWSEISNGKFSVTGTATVTWNFEALTRHVVHDLDWTRLADGRSWTGTGDRVQQPLPGGLDEGLQIDGSRSWTAASGVWDLDIAGVQIRWVDPVPQAGVYTLTTPSDKTLTLSFARVDADTIHVEIDGPKRSFGFDVSSSGNAQSTDAP
ncbi:MAG: hypothetical protein HY908_29070 [Myxococcales bacterium]|nr:hypothetical protein [Myxococcales bacterium]